MSVQFPRLEEYGLEVEVAALARDFLRSRENRIHTGRFSLKTLRNYRQALEQYVHYLVTEGRDTDLPTTEAALRRVRRDVDDFTAALAQRTSKITAATRFAALKQFYKWLADESEISHNPLRDVEPPRADRVMREIVRTDDQKKLLRLLERDTSFEGRRDTAIVRMLLGTGCRLGELAGMKLTDISPTHDRIRVMGKGRKQRDLILRPNTITALDRYLRARRRHPEAHMPQVWLGATGKGELSDNGVVQMLRRRCGDAGITAISPHRFRHTWRHEGQMAGISEDALMTLGGWSTRAMLDLYGASGRSERAAVEIQTWTEAV